MPAPIAWALTAAQMLFPLVSDLFRGHGGATATRNADLIDKIGTPLVEIAKTVTGQPTEQQAAQRILDDPDAKVAFRAAVADDLDRLVGMLERVTKMEDDSRDRAAARATTEAKDIGPVLMDRQFYLIAGLSLAVLIVLAGAVVLKAPGEVLVGLVVLFTGMVNKAYDRWGTIHDYRWGTSMGSETKNAMLSQPDRR